MNSFAFAEGNHGDLLPCNGVHGFFVIVEVKSQMILLSFNDFNDFMILL